MPEPRFSKSDLRRIAIAERRRLHQTLQNLTDDQWATPSLCEGWDVREVAGHVASNSTISMAGFLGSMASVRFDHDEHNRRTARAWARQPTERILAALDSERIMLVFRLNPALLLVDNVVHHQDIRRPLGLGDDFPPEHLAAALECVFRSGMFTSEAARADGRRVVATDLPWSHGDGPEEVRAPAEHLILALMGRDAGAEPVFGN